jgi:GNAT superfamily N-acetyltransferase
MTAQTIVRPRVHVREAEPADNEPLKAIACACPMVGDLTIGLTREPDFFQLNQLEGSRWHVGVAEVDDRVVGCAMVAERRSYLHGVEQTTLYAGDLKVHPSARGAGVADALCRWGRDLMGEMAGCDTPILLTILGGNHAMEQRTGGRGGMPNFVRFATIRSHSIPLLFPRSLRSDYVVSIARPADIDEMAALWQRVASSRQFAPVYTAETLAEWIASAPGLDISSYRLAHDRSGRLVGFLAWWDQACFKQLHVLRYSPRLRAVRAALNVAAGLTRGTPLPDAGEPLRYCSAVNVCVAASSPGVLRSLIGSSYPELRAARYAFATIGLDARDPLQVALRGLFAQPTDAHAHVCTPGGAYMGPSLTDRPLHYEIALV